MVRSELDLIFTYDRDVCDDQDVLDDGVSELLCELLWHVHDDRERVMRGHVPTYGGARLYDGHLLHALCEPRGDGEQLPRNVWLHDGDDRAWTLRFS
jgi:hypothetical protein